MKQNKFLAFLKQPAGIWTIAAVLMFVALPMLITAVVPSDAGMAACVLLFFAIDPIFAIAAGMFAGKRPRELWFLPILNPVLFLLGTWLSLDPGQLDFLTYAMFYLMLGGTTMFVFLIMTNSRRR